MGGTPLSEVRELKHAEIEFIVVSDGNAGKPRGKMLVGGTALFYDLEGVSSLATKKNLSDLLTGVKATVTYAACGSVGYQQLTFEPKREGIVMWLEDEVKIVITIEKNQLELFQMLTKS